MLQSELQRGSAIGLLPFLRECRRRDLGAREVLRKANVQPPNWFATFMATSGGFEIVRQAVEEFPAWFRRENWPIARAFREHPSYLWQDMLRDKEVGPRAWYNHMKYSSKQHVMTFLVNGRLAWYVDNAYSAHGEDWRAVVVAADGRNLWEWVMTSEGDGKDDYAWHLLRIDKRYRLRTTDFRLSAPCMKRNPFLREDSMVPGADTIKELSRVLNRIDKVGNYEACMCWPHRYANGDRSEHAVRGTWAWPGPIPCTIKPTSTRDAWRMVKEYERKKRRMRLLGWRRTVRQ